MSVYRIKSPHSDKVYIGGTFQTLEQRFSEHKSQYKHWLRGDPKALYYSSYEVLKLGDAYIEQVDTHDCLTVGELCEHEAHYQKDANCINKNSAGPFDKKAWSKEYWKTYKRPKKSIKKN